MQDASSVKDKIPHYRIPRDVFMSLSPEDMLAVIQSELDEMVEILTARDKDEHELQS